jgi:hypothetical protein
MKCIGIAIRVKSLGIVKDIDAPESAYSQHLTRVLIHDITLIPECDKFSLPLVSRTR